MWYSLPRLAWRFPDDGFMEHIRCHDGRTTHAAFAYLTINCDPAPCHVGFLFSTDCNSDGKVVWKQYNSKEPAGNLQTGLCSQVFHSRVVVLGLTKLG